TAGAGTRRRRPAGDAAGTGVRSSSATGGARLPAAAGVGVIRYERGVAAGPGQQRCPNEGGVIARHLDFSRKDHITLPRSFARAEPRAVMIFHPSEGAGSSATWVETKRSGQQLARAAVRGGINRRCPRLWA